jgi:hypothetical protein
MRPHVTVLLAVLVTPPALFSQAPSTNQPLQVKEGQWALTISNDFVSSLSDDALAQVPPEQRESARAALKRAQANAQTQKHPLCLTHEGLLAGDILGKDELCTKQQMVSNSKKVEVTLQCGNAQSFVTIERVSDTSFKGTQKTITQDALNSTISSTFSATWIGTDCDAPMPFSEQADLQRPSQPQPIFSQPPERDPYILSLMPPPGGWLGPHVTYVWTSNYPDITYRGALGLYEGHIRFNGTDGIYLYMTLVAHGTICIPPAKLLRVDRAGQVTAVDHAPEGLHGGERLPYYCDSGKDKK